MGCFQLSFLVLILGVAIFEVASIIPPHPNSDLAKNQTWVPVQEYRRRMGISFDYETKVVNPELCRFEDEDTCRHLDRALEERAHRNLQLVRKHGKLNTLVLLVQFDNHDQRNMINSSDIDELFNSEEQIPLDPVIPTGSIRTYFRTNSHDNLRLEALIVPWRTVGFSEQDCLFGNSGQHRDFQRCFWSMLDLLDELHLDQDHFFNWADYDQDLDGYIDSVVVMHSGYGAEWGGVDPDGRTSEERIWSHSIGPQKDRWMSPSYLIDLGSYSVTSAFRGNSGKKITRIGIVAHEMIHSFGIPDLFDVSRPDQSGGVGSYSIMSDPWGQGNDSTLPGHVDPWTKIKLGWVIPQKLSFSGDYTLKPSGLEPEIFMIDDPYPEGEYLLIENRQPLFYDTYLWTTGALIWHIDDKVALNAQGGGPYQGDEWPSNGKHYRVALVQADGKYELEQSINKGHAEDFFVEGSSLGPGRDSRGNLVFPNTDSYQGGNVVATGVTISDFIFNGLLMNFTVSGLPEPTPTSAPVEVLTSPPTNSPPSPPVGTVPSQCTIQVNTGLCQIHMSQEVVAADTDCDCWNFCGNGIGQRCCKFGEICPINCHVGGLVAGCTRSGVIATSAASPNNNDQGAEFVEFLTPGSQDGYYRPFLPEQEILREPTLEEKGEKENLVLRINDVSGSLSNSGLLWTIARISLVFLLPIPR